MDNKQNSLLELGKYLEQLIPFWVSRVYVDKFNNLIVIVSTDNLKNVIFFLKNHTNSQYQQIMDLVVVDNLKVHNRFSLFYILLSVRYNTRVIVRLDVNENTVVPSLINIYPNINWYEREAWDLYGIFFKDHVDLRRILTDYGFESHPFRKDFPLGGYVELRYSEEQKHVVYEPVEYTQEYRSFEYGSSWEVK